ncbi:TPA: ISAs1 family transposase, partial [Klebsiella pneumoniae]|nr:ISAs1 family transposase [Klebsiella pneumoniae]
QPKLFEAVRQALAPLAATPLCAATMTLDKAHGRIDGREYHIMAAGELAAQFPHWEQLRSIGVAISYRIEKREKITIEQRYYISSKALTRDEFARSVRGHWAIENSLHWVLDVTMGEDDCPIYRGDAAEILACIRHMGLNMLRAETSRKASIRRKQKIAGMSSEYLEKVLNGGVSGNPRKFRHSALWNFLGGWSAA